MKTMNTRYQTSKTLDGRAARLILSIVISTVLVFSMNVPAQATPLNMVGTTSANGDSVVGAGTAGFSTFAVDAQSGPSGENAAGTVSFNLAIGTASGTVNFLCVNGNQAVVAGTFDAGVFAGSGYVLHVQDNALAGTLDLLRLEIFSGVLAACPEFSLLAPAAVTAGDIVVVDSVPVTFASLKALTEEYVLASGRPGAAGTAKDLVAILSAAERAAARGNTKAQIGTLNSYVDAVDEAMEAGFLTAEQAAQLQAQALQLYP
jgi:hypothetical protein